MNTAPPLKLGRLMLLAVLLAFLVGPLATGLGHWVDGGGAPLSVLGLLMAAVSVLVREVAMEVEALVFGVRYRPWLHGQIRRRQKLILPFDTASVVGTAVTFTMAGGTVLLTSAPTWSALNIVALGFVALGGLLLGFGLSRLVVGLVLIYRSGLWGVSRQAWLLGGVIVAIASIAHATYSVRMVLEIVPGL
ncbi:MAG TPA: hypothetical protein VN851_22925 [Thermoanaerobaculia bacterium]|nr:hypothetical protein [Thermoanaerobaculia bacterium]